MKTFYEFMETVQQDFATDIAPEGLTRQRADILAPMMSMIDKCIAMNPSFIGRLYTLLKSEALRNPDLQDDLEKLDTQKIKRAAQGLEGSSSDHDDSQDTLGLPFNRD